MSDSPETDNPMAYPAVEPANPTVASSGNDVPEVVELVEPVLVEKPDPFISWLKGGHPLAAWIIIFFLILGVPLLRSLRAPEDAAGQENHLRLLVFTMQAKFMVGAQELMGGLTQADAPDASMAKQAEALNVGSVDQRLRYVALVGELAGFRAAQEKLEALTAKLAQSNHVILAHDELARSTLERLYSNYHAGVFDDPKIDEEKKQNLRQTLGWIGELALAPRGGANPDVRKELLASARAVFITFMAIFFAGGFLALAGAAGLVVLLFYLFLGPRRQGVPAGPNSTGGGIYAETFALWMIIFLIFSFAPLVIQIHEAEMMVIGGATLATLVILVWPVLRGIPWRQVREDIGLVGGPRPALEPFFGPLGYVLSLPLLCVGVFMTWILMSLQNAFPTGWSAVLPLADEFSPMNMPTHPILEYLSRPGLAGKLQILFLASVVAPIVEETMFRGVLYRHLRNATWRWPLMLSCLISALIVSFVFAIIHPQGVVAVPALMALAMGFTLMRQWRGSLISCMIAHGINNALVLSLASFVFSS
jgi:membrane protease YdiL (CAAX protease family)